MPFGVSNCTATIPVSPSASVGVTQRISTSLPSASLYSTPKYSRTVFGSPATSKISRLEIAGETKTVREYLGVEYKDALGDDVEIRWLTPIEADGDTGIIAVQFETPNGTILVD